MRTNRFIYFIVAAFIAGNLILIFIKYNSENNNNNLIKGNEQLLAEFKLSNELKTLESNVWLSESKIRGVVTTNDTAYAAGSRQQLIGATKAVQKLQLFKTDVNTAEDLDRLNALVQKKLRFTTQVLAEFEQHGKQAAEALINNTEQKTITDSILVLSEKISARRQEKVFAVTSSIDESVKRAQRIDSYLIIFTLFSAAVLFWYIINIIRTQSRLLRQVSLSEKKAKEAAEIKEKFLANMSHEIRTPLNAILGFTQLLQHKKLDEEATLYTQTIQQSGQNLLVIVNDILDLSKIEAGMLRVEAAPFSLRSLMHALETLFRAKAAEKKLDFSVQVQDSIPDNLEGDATRLSQILNNLIGNALKFTDAGKVEVQVLDGGCDGEVQTVLINVADTGIGIAKESLHRIFDRFQQAHDGVSRTYGGTGLGLSIVQELVTLQGGTIVADSELEKGTTVRLSLPYKIIRNPAAGSASNFSADPIPATQIQGSVLVVEDNVVNQTLIRHLFAKWKINFDLAGDGEAALQILKQRRFDVIMLDIQMPVMDGYTTAKNIRQQLHLSTPIIAMTAYAMAGEREKCLSMGMNDYISKPLKEESLRMLLQKFCTPVQTYGAHQQQVEGSQKKFAHIQLDYLKEISEGNIAYEQEVTEQFIKAVPEAVQNMKTALQQNDSKTLQKEAHNLKTTISVMGLTEVLEPHLNELEQKGISASVHLKDVEKICAAALPEAEDYLAALR